LKAILKFSFFAASIALSNSSIAGVECFTRISAQLTTKDNHCENHCSTWADRVPAQTVQLEMPDQFKQRSAFFKSPQVVCSGGTCGFGSFPPIGVTSLTNITYTFKHHSRPVVVTVSADVCILNDAVPPVPSPPSLGPVKPPTPAPVPTPAPTPLPIPPQKAHITQEAGPMNLDQCTRMKSNWMSDAKMYCSPYNVNIVATSLTCATDANNLGRSVSGVFLCVK
jgi:hypothetical protein